MSCTVVTIHFFPTTGSSVVIQLIISSRIVYEGGIGFFSCYDVSGNERKNVRNDKYSTIFIIYIREYIIKK